MRMPAERKDWKCPECGEPVAALEGEVHWARSRIGPDGKRLAYYKDDHRICTGATYRFKPCGCVVEEEI
jgi:hypothetical protein